MKILLDQHELEQGVLHLAAQVGKRYGQRPLTIVGVMTGSLILLADLVRQLHMPVQVGIVQASSYREGHEPKDLVIGDLWIPEICGRDVLVVDDIFDTGDTLDRIVRRLRQLQPKSLMTAVLLRKLGRQRVDWLPDFIAFDIPDNFVVGYGLDYQDQYRNLPYVATLEPQDIQAPANPS